MIMTGRPNTNFDNVGQLIYTPGKLNEIKTIERDDSQYKK